MDIERKLSSIKPKCLFISFGEVPVSKMSKKMDDLIKWNKFQIFK